MNLICRRPQTAIESSAGLKSAIIKCPSNRWHLTIHSHRVSIFFYAGSAMWRGQHIRRCVNAYLRKVADDLDRAKTDYEDEARENDQRRQGMHVLPSAQKPHVAHRKPLDANSVSWPVEHWQISTIRVANTQASLSASPILSEPSRPAIIPIFNPVR
jgi:hypothetical protein